MNTCTTIYTMPQKKEPVRIQESCGIFNSMTSNLPIMCHTSVTLTVSATVLYMAWYEIVIQHSLVLYHGTSQLVMSLVILVINTSLLSYAIHGKTTKIIKIGLK